MTDIQKNEALILHSIRWQDSSKIVYLFTREHGHLGVIAKGALRAKSTFQGNLEALNHISCQISFKGNRELQILTSVDVIDSFSQMRLNLEQLPYALAVLEILNQVMEGHQSDEVFFDFIIHILQTLQQSKKPQMVFWYFLLKLASYLGFKPQIKNCYICHTENTSGAARFNFSQGAFYCGDCAANSSGGIKLQNQDWRYLADLQVHPHQKLTEFETHPHSGLNFTRLLTEYLNFHLDKNLELKALQLL